MNYKPTLIKLYHLLVNADGHVNEKELLTGRQMAKAEEIDEFEFECIINSLKKRNTSVVLDECVEELKKLDHDQQVRCLAWLTVIANVDGFMDKIEWHFFYHLYHRELGLQLDEVMQTQKTLVGLKKRSSSMIAVL